MATSKYLNSELILKYIEIFHKLSARYKRIISIEMCKNRALTIHTVMAYSEVILVDCSIYIFVLLLYICIHYYE